MYQLQQQQACQTNYQRDGGALGLELQGGSRLCGVKVLSLGACEPESCAVHRHVMQGCRVTASNVVS
jgi:hypothetical protein